MMRLRLFLTLLLAALVVVIIRAATSKQTPFSELEEGDSYWEGHPHLGWKQLTKVGDGVASAFRQACDGRQFNDFVRVKPDHKVVKVTEP